MCQQGILSTSCSLEPVVATFGKWAVACKDIAELGFGNVIKFFPRHEGPVEWDNFVFHHLNFRTQI